MKPNILLIIHYTSTYTLFSTPNKNGRPGNQSFICKGNEVVNQLHTHLNPCINDENLPLTYHYYMEKYHLGYQLEGAYDRYSIILDDLYQICDIK